MLLNTAKCQGYSFYRLWVNKGKSTGGGGDGKIPPTLGLRQYILDNAIYTFFHKVAYKRLVFTYSYLMVCVRTVKDARCSTEIRDSLMS